MTGGIGRISAEQFWTEQVRLTPLTSDPTGTAEGELWLRADIAEEDDQLATLRLNSGGSTVDIPVFDVAADVPDDVSTQLRLVVDGQQGFVPTVEDGGSIPQLGVWSDGVRHEAIEELFALPDSEELIVNWPIDEGSDSTVNDTSGNNNDGTIKGADWLSDSAVEGGLALDFEPSDDEGVHTGTDVLGGLTEFSCMVAIYIENTDDNNREYVIGDETEGGEDTRPLYIRNEDDDTIWRWSLNDTDSIIDITDDNVDENEWITLGATYDGSSFKAFVDGNEEGSDSVSGDLNTGTNFGLVGGDSFDGYQETLDCRIGQTLVWETDLTDDQMSQAHDEMV